LLGGTRRRGNRGCHGLLGRQRENALLPGGSRPGRNAEGKGNNVMTDRESEFARKLTRCLDRGVADMRPGTLYRLQQARAAAMAAAASRVPDVELATAGVGGASGSRLRPRNAPVRWAG